MLARIIVGGLIASATWLAAGQVQAADIRSMIFPVAGGGTYRDDFGDPRSGGRTHQGNDIFAPKHTPLLATVDGHVRFVTWPQASYGYLVSIEDDDGYEYWYLHINNDRLGTDDGLGGGRFAYAPGIEDGAPVVKGQLIGYLGDSGNAELTSPHLHFEIHRPDGNTINPWLSLNAATRIGRPVVAPPLPGELLPYGEFKGGASVALGEVRTSIDGYELVTGAGPGGGPLVRIFDQYNNPLGGFYAYDRAFRGGVDVTIGDINGDGTNEIITAPGPGMSPYIRAFTFEGNLLAEFLAYRDTFLGGVHVAADDLTGDGITEIVTGPRSNAGPDVRVYQPTGTRLAQWFSHTTLFRGGIDVATIPATLEGEPGYVITSPLRGGGPDIRTYSFDGQLQSAFWAYSSAFRGGVRVAGHRFEDGSTEIITVPWGSGSGHVREFSLDGVNQDNHFLFEEWWTGGYDVAVAHDRMMVSSGPGGRRASVRTESFTPQFEENFPWFNQTIGN